MYLILTFGIMGAALASLIVSFLAMAMAMVYIYKKFKVITNPISIFRILTCALVIFVLASFWHYTGIFVLVTYVILMTIYFGLLFIIGEIKKEDTLLIKKILLNMKLKS